MASPSTQHAELQSLLEFIYQAPFGLARTKPSGEITLMNGVGVQILMPIAVERGEDLKNLDSLLLKLAPDFQDILAGKLRQGNQLCTQHLISLQTQEKKPRHLEISVLELSQGLRQYSFQDVSLRVEQAQALAAANENQALQEGKIEVATSVLHDVGNAVSAFGASVAQLSASLEWQELANLQKLQKLFEARKEGIEQALGAGKGEAMLKFIQAMEQSLASKQATYQEISAKLNHITSHVQGVLNIQRQYFLGKEKHAIQEINLVDMVDNALSMMGNKIKKQKVDLTQSGFGPGVPCIHGDPTQLIQAFTNVIKNALEALATSSAQNPAPPRIHLELERTPQTLTLSITDNGQGFSPELGPSLLERGHSQKRYGTGIGLASVIKIVQNHQGRFELSSPGPGQGATARFTFALG